MKLLGRTFYNDKEKEAFRKGAESKLPKDRMGGVALIRLSSRMHFGGVEIVESIWGCKGRAPAAIFKRSLTLPLPKTTEEFGYEEWLRLGQMIGEDMIHWSQNKEEFDTQERKAWSVQYNVWDTTEYTDVAQDMINELQLREGAHIGPMHWKVRIALVDLITELVREVITEERVALTKKENLDLLNEIVQKSELSAQPKPKPKAPKAAQYVKGARVNGNS